MIAACTSSRTRAGTRFGSPGDGSGSMRTGGTRTMSRSLLNSVRESGCAAAQVEAEEAARIEV